MEKVQTCNKKVFGKFKVVRQQLDLEREKNIKLRKFNRTKLHIKGTIRARKTNNLV